MPDRLAGQFHSSVELNDYEVLGIENFDHPIFQTAGVCKGCHGLDPRGIANVDSSGNDINVQDDWAASMMALSSKDPYWRAKVAHEVYLLPDAKDLIETTCIQCHAPMGHYQALFNNSDYHMEDLLKDTLGLDGVSCMACHAISRDNLNPEFTGRIKYDTNRVAYGPYPMPFAGPMRDFVGVAPRYSFHVFESEMCASCHTLISPSYNVDGNPTDSFFVEQSTYHEWKNSQYAETGVSCQSCHMEELLQPIIVSNDIDGLEPRNYFRKHNFNGANVKMLKAIRDFSDYLGIDIDSSLFNENIRSATKNLQSKSIDLNLEAFYVDDGALILGFDIKNKTGHKFPTGYPARRAYVECIILDHVGDTLFHSGKRENDRILTTNELNYILHYDTINSQDEIQIYQMVTIDSEAKRTTRLMQAVYAVKDNRIPPLGFTSLHPSYDTTKINGLAVSDQNFNRDIDGSEGTGSDQLFYKISIDEYDLRSNTNISVQCKIWYESIPKLALDDMSRSGLNEVDTLFHVLNNDFSPILVQELIIDTLFKTVSNGVEISYKPMRILPNPVKTTVRIDGKSSHKANYIIIHSPDGRKQRINKSVNQLFDLSQLTSGIYVLTVHDSQDSFIGIEKILKE